MFIQCAIVTLPRQNKLQCDVKLCSSFFKMCIMPSMSAQCIAVHVSKRSDMFNCLHMNDRLMQKLLMSTQHHHSTQWTRTREQCHK